eukprot:57854-Rhodomonas_salina.7
MSHGSHVRVQRIRSSLDSEPDSELSWRTVGQPQARSLSTLCPDQPEPECLCQTLPTLITHFPAAEDDGDEHH